MKPLQSTATIETRYLSVEAAKNYLSLGQASIDKIATAAGARVKIGRRVLYDRVKLEAYIESLVLADENGVNEGYDD